MANRLKVVMLTTSLAYGGAEVQVVTLSRALKARGWDVEVISMLPPEAFTDVLEDAGIRVHSLDMRRGVPDPRALLRLARIVRSVRPDIVHAHMVHANLMARALRLLEPVPVLVCTAHSLVEGGRLLELAYRFTDRLCDVTTHVSQAGFERYVNVRAAPPHKIRVIPNGVDLERFRPDARVRARVRRKLGLGSAFFVWISVGRLDEPKDYPTLLRAFSIVQQTRPCTLLIAGHGPHRAYLEGLTRELGLADAVRFLGRRGDAAELLKAADAFVLSSRLEGLPMVLLEASATGLPVVVTNVPGTHEVVLDGLSGFVVPVGDPDGLAQAMLRVLRMSEEALELMAHAGRRHVEAHFSVSRVVEQWETLYHEFLQRIKRH